ncbi:MAG: SpoIIE family protein phosphatase [Bacteroidota bacterium]|nr:SpoIIE family protein phosphatase [Bacteroidota bacterium]
MNINKDSIVSPKRVKLEFYRSTEKFHVIACWVGALLNLVWFASDYFVLPEHWIDFGLFRFAVSAITVIAVVFRKKLKISIYTCMFIVVLGISIQNAYMWSVMDLEHLHQHAFAYLVLFIGAGMLVLWELKLSIILLIATIVSNIVFYKLNSALTFQEFLINGGLLTLTVAAFSVFMIRSRYKLTYNEIKGRMELEQSKKIIEAEHTIVLEQKKEIENQKHLIEEKHKEITDSINYAERIQRTFLATNELLDQNLKDYFVFFKPKDVVSGDFYWANKLNTGNFAIVTADSTGHGVPGAIMSLLNITSLEKAVENFSNPADILNHTRTTIINRLKRDGSVEGGKDGMDCSLCLYDFKNMKLSVSAAHNPVWIVRNAGKGGSPSVVEVKPDKMPVGKHDRQDTPFSQQEIELQEGDVVYTLTDGFPDQFGGKQGKKYMSKNLRQFLADNAHLSMEEQQVLLEKTFESWKGTLEQIDDVCIIGIRL